MRSKAHSKPSHSCHICELCHKKFGTSYGLKSHKRKHTGEKPFICSETLCHKQFSTSGDLQKHIRTHTGEKPFQCKICNRAFTTSTIRKVHMRIHTGEKPYECKHSGCGRKFISATNLQNHIRIHTGEKPYLCSKEGCQKRFTEYSSLYKHCLIHSKDRKSHICRLCHKQYKQITSLKVHSKVVHKLDLDDGNCEVNTIVISECESTSQFLCKEFESLPDQEGPFTIYASPQDLDNSKQTEWNSLLEANTSNTFEFESDNLKTVVVNGSEAILLLTISPPEKDPGIS